MQKQISSTRHTNHAKRWAENCTGMWSRGLRNQNRKLLINLCKANVVETQAILPNHPFPIALWWVISMFMLLALSTGNEVLANSLYNELTITLFSVESLNNINIEITHHRVIGDGWFGKEYLLNDSVFCQVLNTISDDVLEENV